MMHHCKLSMMSRPMVRMVSITLPFYIVAMTSAFLNRLDDPIDANLRSLLKSMIIQLPDCLVLVHSQEEEYSYVHLLRGVHGLRVNINSPQLKTVLLSSYTMKCDGYIVEGDSSWRMLTTLGSARSEARERQTPRVLVLPSQNTSLSPGLAVFRHPESAYIPDILVISSEGEEKGTLSIYTNDFVKIGESYLLSKWPSNITNFFPDKTVDLQGKEMRVATIDYPPYTLLSPTFDGMEARFIMEFCKRYNCSITTIADDYLWGEIYGNGSGTGISGNVYMDKADVGVGAVYAWEEEHRYVDYSYPYLRTKVTVLVPKPEQLAEWRIPLLPFSPTMWALQVISVLMAAVVLSLVNRAANKFIKGGAIRGEFSSFGGIVIRSLAMALLQPPPARLPSTSPLRRFFTIFEALFLFFTTIYSGALSSVLTVPVYYPPIDTPEELYEAGIPWAATHDAWTYSIKGATEPYLIGLVSRYQTHDSDELIRLAKKGGYGFGVEIMATGHATEQKHLPGETILGLHVMKTELYSTSLVILLRKGSAYTDKVNDLLGRCLDSGLLLLWETNVTLNYLSSRLQTAVKISEGTHVEVHEPTTLSLVHVQGAFISLALGLFFSAIVFTLEKVLWSKNQINNKLL